MSQSTREELVEALWVALICRCESCNIMLELDEIESIMDFDTLQWAEKAADVAQARGWAAIAGKITCNECLAKDSHLRAP